MRINGIPPIAAIFIIILSMVIPFISAADIQEPPLTNVVPVNDSPLYTVAAQGPSVPLSSFEKQEEITIFRIELNQTTFPGPRSMAFGPRYIQLTASPASLIILIIGFLAGSVVLFIVYKRKKAGEVESVCTVEEEEAKENRENGD